MDGLSGISGAGARLSAMQIQSQAQVAGLKKQIDVAKNQGEASLKLIESAKVTPGAGRNLDVSV